MDTKEIIKRLMAERKVGTEQLYVKIPVFMRTRLSKIIDEINWSDISEACVMGKQGSMQEAHNKYNEVLANINKYIELCKSMTSDTDNTMFMMADYNYILNEYGSDPSKFAREMAHCIQMEKDLIENFKRDTTGATLLWQQCNFENQPADSQPAIDLAEQESVEMERDDPLAPMLTQFEKWIDEAENLCIMASNDHSEMTEMTESSALYANIVPFSEDIGMTSEELAALCKHEERLAASDKFFQNKTLLIEKLKVISEGMTMFLDTLSIQVTNWNNEEAKKSVGVGPGLPFQELSRSFESFGGSLQRVLTMFAGGSFAFIHEEDSMLPPTDLSSMSPIPHLHQNFKKIERLLFQINLVVDLQPKELMSIESAGKKDSAAATSATESSKKQKSYCTKKNQNIETSVRLLVGNSFPNVMIENARIDLVSEKDLASPQSPTQLTGKERRPKLDFGVKFDQTNLYVKFNEVAVKNFSRIEQNTVYKQFFRIQYLIDVVVNGIKYSLKTLSLPFMFHTGSNQILELIGARMWYIANVQDMYHGNFTCPDNLDVNQVIDMLDNRVTYLDKRQRRLTEPEKEFLKKRLPSTTGDKVTMQGFIKDKMKKSRTSEELPFSFHTWFHAVLHSFHEYLLEPWIDGIIYGFCSETTTKNLLMRSDIAAGTFILRPSISNDIKNMSSKEATAAITMDIKLLMDKSTDPAHMYQVQSVPIFIKTIHKNSLYGAIYGILKNNSPIAKFVYTASEIKPVSCLRRYKGKTDSKNQLFKDYKLLVEKVENFSIRETDDSVQGSSSNDRNQDDFNHSGPGPSTRKRRLLSSQSSTSSSAGQGRSTRPMSRSASREDSNLPAFNELNQEPQIAEMVPLNSRLIPTQGQRLGRQSNSVPETHNPFQVCTVGNSIFSFQGIQVDTSNIPRNQLFVSMPVHNNINNPGLSEMSMNLVRETAIRDQELGSQLLDFLREGFPTTGRSMDSLSSSFSSSSNTMSPESLRSESSPDNLPRVLEDVLEVVLEEALEMSLETERRSNVNGVRRNRNRLSMNDQNMNPFSSQPIINQPWSSPNDSGIDGDEIPSPDPMGNRQPLDV
ncbi:unnamed protein product [Lymnaea stagnalis]|uniref:Signal transducer and activator of transcription n=1 Tax=Lymnaea stagnalis TaxID=6523 RepID=A0AAV2HJ64_LYMST